MTNKVVSPLIPEEEEVENLRISFKKRPQGHGLSSDSG